MNNKFLTFMIFKILVLLKDLAYKYYKGFYNFDIRKYPKTFLVNTCESDKFVERKDIKEVVYCFWTGSNALTENRKQSLEKLRRTIGYPIILITPNNLAEYILPQYPLHPAYQYLSLVHKSDYLRAYFMHHYGGGYCDLKRPISPWRNAFRHLDNKDIWVIGCPEPYGLATAPPQFKINREDYKSLSYDIRKYYRYIPYACSFICRPHTNFTQEWLNRLHDILDQEYENLKNNPGKIHGWEYENYPLYGKVGSTGYTSILAQIFHPLSLKYHQHIMFDQRLLLSFEDYR